MIMVLVRCCKLPSKLTITACKVTDNLTADHFVDVNKTKAILRWCAILSRSFLIIIINMPDKFRNKYCISPARLQNWDYGRNAAYFVTICTKSRFHYFGRLYAIFLF